MTTPKREAVRAELLQRARALFGEEATALDFACDWTANAKTLTRLAAKMSEALGVDVSRETVRRAVAVDEEDTNGERRLRAARVEGASVMVDEARAIADEVSENREAIAKAKLRSDLRVWVASKWGREEYGEQKSSLVQISASELHIDAMRQHAIRHPVARRLPEAVAEPSDDAPDE